MADILEARRNQARGATEWEDAYGTLGMAVQAQLTQLPLNVLDPWGDSGRSQPFKPYSAEKLRELADNIQKNGVIEPICVRPKPNGRFEIVAGHNRVAAARLAGLTVVPALARQLDDDQATVLMVDSNLQHREQLLPSEKAFAYKAKLEALNRQGQRSDLTSPQIAAKFRADDEVGKSAGISGDTVRRYIRLTYLIQPLLEFVDENKLVFNAAVEISYLEANEQRILRDVLKTCKKKLSLAQAKRLRKLAGTLDYPAIEHILTGAAKEQTSATVRLPFGRISGFFPPNTTPEQMEEEIYNALTAYRRMNDNPRV